jgi:hypothetical protein
MNFPYNKKENAWETTLTAELAATLKHMDSCKNVSNGKKEQWFEVNCTICG